ncbi:MAG TPA: flagellar hook-basal body complex protein FliE [Geomonas sp.]
MVINAIGNVSGLAQAFPAQPAKAAQNGGADFGKLLGDMVGKVNDLQNSADKSIQSLATGESKGLHEVMLAVEKASISFQMLTQVRNKAMEAYQEIMRMPV